MRTGGKLSVAVAGLMGLVLIPAARAKEAQMGELAGAATGKVETATFGAGCFWCTEAVFERVPGVLSVRSGFMGGTVKDPTYKQVCAGATGHAEVTRLDFDPSRVSYESLLDLFWRMHDPTTLNRQGADVGTQYRSVIFFHSAGQKKAAEASKAALAGSGRFDAPVVTEIVQASEFYPAEDYHQDYYRRNSEAAYCRFVIAPKLKKLGMKNNVPDRPGASAVREEP
jgi:peptide-methionine (S)-S-oxide reductase